jgi:hypothetical protein
VIVGEWGAANVGGAVGVGAGWRRRTLWRCGGRRLGGEECSGKESGGGEEMEGSHRAALIHRGGREVKRWSYQF